MSDNFPDFVTWAHLDDLRECATDDEIEAAYRGSLVYAAWQLRRAFHDVVLAVIKAWRG